ncbi:MAG: hypothetical protein OEV42_15005 [Deltaproteobacteria bacterium]|nr:hypothetical protein [Deltaproteobacteria bacterium]
MKGLLLTLSAVMFLLNASPLNAAVQRDRVKLGNPNELTSYCIEGHVFVVAVGQSFGENTTYAPAITQVYTYVKKGKVLPMKCLEKKPVKRKRKKR